MNLLAVPELVNDEAALFVGDVLTTGLYAAEIDYLMTNEWARRAEDVLWRRRVRPVREQEAGGLQVRGTDVPLGQDAEAPAPRPREAPPSRILPVRDRRKPSKMQFHLDGFKPGDPHVRAASAQAPA